MAFRAFPVSPEVNHHMKKKEIRSRLEAVSRGEDKLIHRDRIMHMLGIGRTKCYELMADGSLGPVFKVGVTRKVLESCVLSYLESAALDPTA